METNKELQTLEGAKIFVENLSEECKKNLMNAMKAIEAIENLPKLEKKNFRINSRDRKEITDSHGIKVKINPEGDVREYLEGNYKWEQLFTLHAAIREADKAGKTLPASWTTYRDIIKWKYKRNYQDFLKGEKIIFSGWHGHYFYDIDNSFELRCADGSDFYGDREGCCSDAFWEDPNYGYSVRCIK